MAKKNHSTSGAGVKNTGRQSASERKPRAVTKAERQQRIQTALFEIADAASAVTDMQSFYKRLHEIVGKLMYAENFIILLYDAATNIRSVPYVADSMGDLPPPSGPVQPGSLLAEVLAHPRTLHYTKRQNEEAIRAGQMYGTPSEDFVGIPLTVEDQVIGGIIVQSYIKGIGYSDEDIRLLEFVAQHIAIALTRVRAIEETRQRNSELAIINSVQAGLASKLDMQGIYDLVGDKICEIFDVQAIQVISFDHKKNLMYRNYLIEKGQRLYVDPMPISKVWAYFISDPRSILLSSVENFIAQVDPGFTPPVGHAPRSLIAVPLMVSGELRGAIDLENLDRENAFSESDVRLLETLANSMSVALENARLWEQEKLYRKALQRELEIGREIQAGFLPEALPQIEGWEIAASLLSAREVAGDFYDAFELPDGTIGLVIADVCDKGVGAALFMTLFRSLIRAASNLDYFEHVANDAAVHAPAERLQRAMTLTNNYIAKTHEKSGMFATLFFGILDPRDGRLAYINGGHEPPLIVHEGIVREVLVKTGPAVGLTFDGCFELRESTLQPGETLLAYTDGVPDCQSPRGDFYGRDNLLAVLRESSTSSLDLVKAIESDLRQYAADATRFDDITLLAVRRS